MNSPSGIAVLGLGPTEIVVVLAIFILLFGATKLPQLARGMGQSIKEFRNASRDTISTDASATPAEKGKTKG